MNHSKVFVIIPVHNRKEITRRCLSALAKQTLPGFNTIVIDDGSTDGTSEMIKKDFPEVVLLRGDGNLWWTGGTNLGIKHALGQQANIIVTLNDDVIIKSNYLKNSIKAHGERPNALIGSINLSQEKPCRLLYAGIVSLNSWTAKCVKRGKLLAPYDQGFKGLLATYSLPGRGTLIPCAVFEKIGFFDEKHFSQYAADQDFSLRARDSGFDLVINADNPVYSPFEAGRTGGDEQSFLSFFKSFFTMRSCNYLPVLIRYNFRHHPHKAYFPIFIMLDLGRRIFSFIGTKMRSR